MNAIMFVSGFVRDITGTGTILADRAGALRNAEFSRRAPWGRLEFDLQGIIGGDRGRVRAWVNAKGEVSWR